MFVLALWQLLGFLRKEYQEERQLVIVLVVYLIETDGTIEQRPTLCVQDSEDNDIDNDNDNDSRRNRRNPGSAQIIDPLATAFGR